MLNDNQVMILLDLCEEKLKYLNEARNGYLDHLHLVEKADSEYLSKLKQDIIFTSRKIMQLEEIERYLRTGDESWVD